MSKKYYAGGFVYNPQNNTALIHKRDGNTKQSPNMWAFFGGSVEECDSSPEECFLRELAEETGIEVGVQQVAPVCTYVSSKWNRYRYIFYIESGIAIQDVVLGEGERVAWVSYDDLKTLNTTNKMREILNAFLQEKMKQGDNAA